MMIYPPLGAVWLPEEGDHSKRDQTMETEMVGG